MSRLPRIASLVVLAGVTAASSANGAVIFQGGGWRAEVANALVPDVSLTGSAQGGVLTINKEATFRTVNGLTGLPNSINITFTQIADDANTASRIVLDSELVTNLTGLSWTSFTITIQGQATIDQAASAGFSIAPFTARAYPDARTVTYSGGTVAAGGTWTPGAAGALVWDIDLSGPNPAVFTLKELPVPAPGAAMVLALGAGLVARRRRGA